MTSFSYIPQGELIEPLADLSAWAAHFRGAEIPVLRETSETLEALRANEDRTDANSIGEMIAGDPMMTLKVLAYASDHRSQRVVTRAETVTAALVMMGISPFFRAFSHQPTIEDRLAPVPSAWEGLSRVLRRAHRSANFALGFAIHRTDPNAAAIHAAALLHEFGEMLLWLHAPKLALRIQRAQDADKSLRSNVAQQSVLGFEIDELQAMLVASWQLPVLLSQPRGAAQTSSAAGARAVGLAARLARHTSLNWDNAALPDDIAEIAEFLNMSTEAAFDLARGIDQE